MKFWEAMKAMQEGKKVRKKDWKQGTYTDQNQFFDIYPYPLDLQEWELYEESKPKIELIAEHVGRRVKRRDNAIVLIDAYLPDKCESFRAYGKSYTSDGKGLQDELFDIVEILE